MTQELSRLQLMELFNAESPRNIERLEKINAELEARIKDIDEIGEQIARGGVRSIEQLNSMLIDLENHRARAIALNAEAELMQADFLMDLKAISKPSR